MRKSLLALVPALLVSACGGGSTGGTDGASVADAAAPQAPGTIDTVLGTGERGYAGAGEAPAAGFALDLPLDVTVGDGGELYVLDWNNFMIRVLDGDRVRPIAGNGSLDDVIEGPALETGMNHVGDMLLDGHGGLLVAAWHNSRVVRVDLATATVAHVAGTGARAYSGDDGPAREAAFDLPAALAWDASGGLLVTDQQNQVLRRIDLESGAISHVAGSCVIEPDGPCDAPVACPGTQKRACDLAQCGFPCSPAFAGDGSDLAALRLGLPFGAQAVPSGKIAVAPDGTIYVADTSNDRIRAIAPGGVVSTVAGGGASADDGVPATTAALDQPSDLALAPDGALFVVLPYDHCVRRVDPAGTITTVAGVCGTAGDAGDLGPATDALLDRPYGIALDAARRRLYVADTGNYRIRVVALPE